MKFAARAVLALTLLAGVYLLAAGVLAALGLALYEAWSHGVQGYLFGKGSVLLVLLVLAVGRALWAVRRAGRAAPKGLPLSPEEQPALWNEVQSIAAEVGTATPDEILLVPEVNASVWEGSRMLGLVGGRRVMMVGVPLLLGLSRQQLRAVLAHELGHYSHRHTALAPVIYRGHLTLAHLVESLGSDTLTGRLFAAYGRLYLRLTRSLTRRQELEADEWSQRVAGRAASAGALRQLPALDAAWAYFVEEAAFAVDGVRPEELFDGFRRLLGSPRRQQQMTEIRDAVPVEEQSPYDTHPTLKSRVEHFESLLDDGIIDDGTPASDLVLAADRTLLRLESEMFANSGLEPRPWSWIAQRAGNQRTRANASLLVRANREPGAGAATLRDAIRALAQGDSRQLVAPYVPPDLPSDQVDAAAQGLVADAIAAALVEHCGARFSVDWDSDRALVDPDGKPIDVAGLVSAVVDAQSADWLVEVLHTEGVPPWYAVDPAEIDLEAEAAREPAVHAVAACRTWFRVRVVAVADPGLVVKRMGIVEGFVALFRHLRADAYVNSALHVASMPAQRVLADRRATVVPWDRVGPTRLSGTRLTARLDGKERRLKIQRQAVVGDLIGSLRHFLDSRLTVV